MIRRCKRDGLAICQRIFQVILPGETCLIRITDKHKVILMGMFFEPLEHWAGDHRTISVNGAYFSLQLFILNDLRRHEHIEQAFHNQDCLCGRPDAPGTKRDRSVPPRAMILFHLEWPVSFQILIWKIPAVDDRWCPGRWI